MSDFGKNRVLALYKILTAYTDELHQISMQDILVHMEAEGYSCSEDSILRYIKQLRNELGVDVISGRGRNARYFIGNRLLEKEEMKLIIDSVNASNFIEKSIATKMIDKLKSTMSLYDAEELDRSVLGINTAKAENKKILYNVNLIQEALSKGVQISFDYMVWDRNKKLVKKSDRRYNMNPWALIWANDRYYLYGYDIKEKGGILSERNYRVDKLDNIKLSDIPRTGKSQFRIFNAMYNNLTGKLFYHDPSWRHKDKLTGKVNFIRFLEIVVDPGMYLNLEHKTFKRYDRESNGLYVIDSKTGEFRKKLKTDTNVITYKEGSLPHNHFRVDNFDISDITHFRKSKMGVMEQFLRDVNDNLSKYMSIEIVEREDAQEFDISNLEKKGISELEYGEMLQKKGVVIVDENNSEVSKDIVAKLQEELEKYYHVKAAVGNLSEEAYNIRIIHDGEYYAENEMHDPHSDNLKGYIVQHITEEAEHFTNTKGSSPDIKKIVQELIIKGDVRECMISIFDWERLDSEKDWTFVFRKKIKTKYGENAAHINHVNKKALNYFQYYRLKIDCNGEMEFDTFCDSNQDEAEEWNKICYAYDFVEDKHRGAQNQVEGLMYSDIDNIHAILLTREKTLPNISALMNTLMETDAKERVSKELLLEAIDDFEKDNIDSRECISEWKSKVAAETEMITKKALKKILNMRTGIASKFNRFLHEKYGVWIDGELRKGEFEATYQIGNLLNIKYEYNEKDYLDGRTFVYYVGAKSKRLAYPNACCMRKVISLGEELEYEEALPLMAVEFVRNSQYTVLPFPFKYLREYIEQC